jgi:hypothetical protein
MIATAAIPLKAKTRQAFFISCFPALVSLRPRLQTISLQEPIFIVLFRRLGFSH